MLQVIFNFSSQVKKLRFREIIQHIRWENRASNRAASGATDDFFLQMKSNNWRLRCYLDVNIVACK